MILCTVCARGGSKGLPGKNTKLLLGEPLIIWSIAQAKLSGIFDHIIVSSDDDEILTLALNAGVNIVRRPAELATDEAGKISAIVHAVEAMEELGILYDTIIDLDVTSPLREPNDIVAAWRLQQETDCTNVITACHAQRSPYFNLVEVKDDIARLSKPSKILRRQDSPDCYDMNASIYVWNRDKFMAEPKLFYDDTRLYVMPRERSIDIDDQLDFDVVEMIMRRRCLN